MTSASTSWPKLILVALVATITGVAAATVYQSRRGDVERGDRRAPAATTGDVSSEAADGHGHKQWWTCGMHPQVMQDHSGVCPICHMKLVPMRADVAGTSGRVVIDPTVVQNMGVRTAPVTRGALDVTVRAAGILKVPEPGLHEVSLKVGGWIERLYADTDGMYVKKDQPLFELYSPEFQVAAEELMTATRAFKSLDPGAGEAVRKEAAGLVESAKRKLRLWDVAEQDIEATAKADRPPRTVVFRSPVAGHVVEKTIVQGAAVQAGMKLMLIEDHSTLWLDAEVYPQQQGMVSVGQRVEARVESMPDKTFAGAVSFVYPHVDHMARTLTVRTPIDNPDHELRPGMYASVTIVTRPVEGAVLVPREAVIDTGTRQIAFVATANEGSFEPRDVRTGLVGDDDKVQILEGLAPGEIVVNSGQFLMDVESRTIEAIRKLRRSTRADRNLPRTDRE